MTKLVIDMRMSSASGIGTYINNLVPRIAEFHFFKEIVLLGNENLNRLMSESERISVIQCSAPIYSIKEQVEIFKKIPKDTDLFWSPHYNIPLLYKGKLLVTVHDVLHLALPQFAKGIHKRMYTRLFFSAIAKKASAVLTVSNYSKQEMIKHTSISPERIFPIHLGINQKWLEDIQNDTSVHHKPYILYVGNVKPHKNLVGLVQAFKKIMDRIDHDVVIVGKKEGFITGDDQIAHEVEGLDDRILFTGYIKEDILKQYYSQAQMLVFPSLYEGFGLPPLEAMAFGCPVIVSDQASIPEVCGEAAVYCNPYSPTDIADKIMMLVNDAALWSSLKDRGLKRSRQFSWEKCAEQTIEVIQEVLKE